MRVEIDLRSHLQALYVAVENLKVLEDELGMIFSLGRFGDGGGRAVREYGVGGDGQDGERKPRGDLLFDGETHRIPLREVGNSDMATHDGTPQDDRGNPHILIPFLGRGRKISQVFSH
jgi:hypothetical protein